MEDEEKPRISYKRIFWMLLPTLKRYWYYFPIIAFLSIFLSALAVGEPFLYGMIVDSIVHSVAGKVAMPRAFAAIAPFLTIWIVLVLLQTVLTGVATFLRWYARNKQYSHFLVELYRRMLDLDVHRFQEEKGGELLRRFDNSWEALFNLNNQFTGVYLDAITRLILALGVGLWVDWRLTLVALSPVPIIIAIGYFNLLYTEKDQKKANDRYDAISGNVGDTFDNITTVKAFCGEDRSVEVSKKKIWEAYAFQNRVNIRWAIGDGLIGPTYLIGRLAIFFVGTFFVLQGTSSIGTLIMFLGFVSFMYGSVQQIMFGLPDVARSFVRLSKTTDYWEEVPAIKDRPGAKSVKRLEGDVIFDGVTYGYHDGEAVLHGVSFEIPTGQTFALVGESGAGKSTLAQMMLRFHDPKSGRILIDGLDLRDIKLDSLRSNIGFVMQENLLFHDTILNNIRFAKPSASEREIIAAAKRAQAHDFIKGLKNGYKTIVGERGVKLSGGEKQRVALARVLLADPPILVLDEATSALDSKTEHALQTALHEVMKNRTTLVIAHRLSTVMNADNILVMHKGKIVDQGKHADLIQRGGLYKQYWEIQAGGYV